MKRAVLALVAVLSAGTASAQVFNPGQPYVGDPMADQLRDRMEQQRQGSADQAAFARQHGLNARLTQLELHAQRRPEPYVPLVETSPRPLETEGQAREHATAQRQSTVAGVTQIDDWLARGPR